MFMLESHLSSDQSRVVAEVQAAATHANLNIFLTGGTMRDMLGGFPMMELDFTVEGNALKLAQTVAKKTGAKLLETDDNRKAAKLLSLHKIAATTFRSCPFSLRTRPIFLPVHAAKIFFIFRLFPLAWVANIVSVSFRDLKEF